MLEVLVWGFVTTYLGSLGIEGVNFVSVLLGGLILWRILQMGQYESVLPLMDETWSRNLLNIFASPLTVWEFLTASLLISFLKISLSISTAALISFFLYAFNLFSLGFYLLPFIMSLLITGWVVGFFVSGTIVRFGHNVQALTWTSIWILQPFSCVFYPLSALPFWAQRTARLLPSTYIFEGMRAVLIRGTLPLDLLLKSALLNLVYLVISLLFFKKMFSQAKKHGLLSKMM